MQLQRQGVRGRGRALRHGYIRPSQIARQLDRLQHGMAGLVGREKFRLRHLQTLAHETQFHRRHGGQGAVADIRGADIAAQAQCAILGLLADVDALRPDDAALRVVALVDGACGGQVDPWQPRHGIRPGIVVLALRRRVDGVLGRADGDFHAHVFRALGYSEGDGRRDGLVLRGRRGRKRLAAFVILRRDVVRGTGAGDHLARGRPGAILRDAARHIAACRIALG